MHGATKQKPTCAGQQNRPVPDPPPWSQPVQQQQRGFGAGGEPPAQPKRALQGPGGLAPQDEGQRLQRLREGGGALPGGGWGAGPDSTPLGLRGGGGTQKLQKFIFMFIMLIKFNMFIMFIMFIIFIICLDLHRYIDT